MRGAKPSSGLVHLHKSFVELHFSGRLPQNVSIAPCVDGTTLGTVLPGQVYATSCGQDHWLLGLQFIFKAYKEPVITNVEKTGDSQVTVAIATQGLQDKYTSDDPEQRAELQRSMEAAALKFAQTAVMRKAGRLQVSGPNINIPKKQLRAQWPAVLERLAPQEVTAHIFVDSTDAYIACAAKIILTKAKAEPVFYLSGLSQLLKSFMGAYVTMELMPNEQVVRLNIDTGTSRQASMSTTAAAAAGTASQTDQAETSSAAVQQPCVTAMVEGTGTGRGERKRSRSSQSGDTGSGARRPAAVAAATAAATLKTATAGECAGITSGAAAAGNIVVGKSSPVTEVQQAPDNVKSPVAATGTSHGVHSYLKATAPTARQHTLEGIASSNVGAMRDDSTPRGVVQHMGQSPVAVADNSDCSSLRPPAALSGHMASPKLAGVQAAAAGAVPLPCPAAALQPVSIVLEAAAEGAETARSKSGAASSGITPGSDAGLWLLADHAVQLQAVGSTGNLSSAAAAAVAVFPVAQKQRRQHSSGSRREGKARPGSRSSDHVAEAPSPAGVAAASINPLHADLMLLDPAAAVTLNPAAALASAGMPPAVVPPVAVDLQAMDTIYYGCSGAATRTALQAGADCAGLATQRSAGLSAAAVGASGQLKPAVDSSAAVAAVCGEEYPRLEGWQTYPKRRRTARAAEAHDHQQHQQDYSGVLPGHVQVADMDRSVMYQSDAAAIGQYWRWGAAAMAARADGGAQNMLQPYMHPPSFQRQHPGCFLEEQQCNQLQQQQQQMLSSSAHLLAAPAFTSAECKDVFVSHNDDVSALAQQHADQHGLGGAVAVVTRVGSDASLTAHKTQLQQQKLEAIRAVAELEAVLAAQQQQQMYSQGAAAHWQPAALPIESKASQGGPAAVDNAALQPAAPAAATRPVAVSHIVSKGVVGLQPLGTKSCARVMPPDWSPAMQPHLSSPSSNTSSISRVPVGHGSAPNSTPGSCSPALAAAQGAGAVAAAAGGSVTVSKGGGASIALAGDACGVGCGAGQALQLEHIAEPAVLDRDPDTAAAAVYGLRPPAGSTLQGAGSCSRSEAQLEQQMQPIQRSPLSMHNYAMAAAVDQPGRQLLTAVLAAAAGPPDVMHIQQQQQQHALQLVPGDQAAAVCADGWPILPDADNLLAVGKALVQVMNLLGAGSEARLVLTRALRIMSPHDREWLLSITYPHLQDSCRRRALPEMRMILNEVAGMDCFADTSAPAADIAGVGMAAGRGHTGHTY